VLGLPLARALALARDDGGRLTLTLPVSGAIAETERTVANAVVDALAPVITAPVAGIEGGRPVVVPFGSGSDALENSAADLVDRVAALLHHRPVLAVTVRGRSAPEDPPADRNALAAARAERVRARLCRERGVSEKRVRVGAPASGRSPSAVVEVALGPSTVP
jgi:outer membrane protein OmpA-like peptidoglycan-associated protein